jgi:hypothetical protein
MDNQTTAPASADNTPSPDEAGGSLSFDAARAMREAFESPATETAAATPVAPAPASAPAPTAEAVKPEVKGPSADSLVAALKGKKDEPAAPKDDELGELPGDDIAPTPGAKTKWAEQRRALKEERTRRQELEAKLAALESKPREADPTELKAMRERIDAQERELEISRVEATQEYKEAVVEPLRRIDGIISATAKKYEVREADLRTAFAESDSERQTELLVDIASGMNDLDRFRLYELAEEFRKVQGIRTRIAGNAKLANQKLDEHRQAQAAKAQEEMGRTYNASIDAVWKSVEDNVPLFRKREGDDAWNGAIDNVVQTARSVDIDRLEIPQRADFALRAAAAPFLYTQLTNLFEKYQEVSSALEKYTATTPGAGGGTSPAVSPEGGADYEDFLDAVKAGMTA